HMFTAPKPEHIELLEKAPENVLGNLYDLVLNGTELGSGSIRINDPELQEKVMKVVGLSHDAAEKKFGFLLEAYRYGAPVHGGMGIGFDRTVALMMGLHDIREVIAFPKNKKAESPMDGSPSEIEERQLKELHVKTDVVKKSE
ncbi:MAG: amino acid--tRNA ligase-related protein, partial [Nanoarchaeota archaeon]